jgi:hypothetical protein
MHDIISDIIDWDQANKAYTAGEGQSGERYILRLGAAGQMAEIEARWQHLPEGFHGERKRIKTHIQAVAEDSASMSSEELCWLAIAAASAWIPSPAQARGTQGQSLAARVMCCAAIIGTLVLGHSPQPVKIVKSTTTQVEVYYEDVPVGYWSTTKFSGALPARRVHELTTRVERLQAAVKFAREEANSMAVTDQRVGDAFFGYLLG